MKTAYRTIWNTVWMVVVALFAVPSLIAQQATHSAPSHELDFSFTYTAQRSNTTGGNSFWLQGGNAQIAGTMYHGLGVVADVTATRASKINATGVNLTLVSTTFGPRYTWALPVHKTSARQLRFFAETMGGIVNGLDSAFPDPSGVQSNAEGTALQVGGGVDLTLSRHFALRLMQAHWLRTWIPNAYTGAQNNFTTGAGIVFRIP